MTPYRPDRFTATYAHFNGAAVWAWLHQPDILIALQTAVTLRRPAVEAISPHLRTTFAEFTNHLKFRQMVGHMVRQVMEEHGFHMHRSNVRIPASGSLYGYGAVYAPRAA